MNFSGELIRRLALQLFFRPPTPFNGLEARRITALTHKVLGITTRPAQFKVLVSAVFRVGRYVEPIRGLNRVLVPDWRPIEVATLELLDGQADGDLFDDLFNRLKARIGNYSSVELMGDDWVEVTNRVLCEFSPKLDNIDLLVKLKFAGIIDGFLEQRREELANEAAREQEISIDELVVALTDAIADGSNGRSAQEMGVANGQHTRNEHEQDCVEEVSVRSDPRSAPAIREAFFAVPPTVAKIAMRRWREIERDSLAEKLWTKHISGTSGRMRELKVISQGTHYRLLYRADKLCTRPFLAFGLRRDLKRLIEKSKALVE